MYRHPRDAGIQFFSPGTNLLPQDLHPKNKTLANCAYLYILCITPIHSGARVTDLLFLSQNDSRPMYLQIMDQIKQKILSGDWPAGQALPSIRELSASTKVSVITVKRAYTELEEQGVIVTQAGRGSFVADTVDAQKNLVEADLEKSLLGLINAARALGLSNNHIVSLVKKALAED